MSGSFLRNRKTEEGASENENSSSATASNPQCPPCPACDAIGSDATNNGAPSSSNDNKIKLRFLVAERSFARLQVMLEQMAEDYTRKLGASAPEITVVGLPTLAEVEREVKFDVLSSASQFDGYIITPLWIGELAEGLFETTDFKKDYQSEDPQYWTDILLFYREVISSYDNKLYLFPFDGDVISMFYRRDLLEKYEKDVPKTWDEYNELVAFFHGKTDTIYDEEGTFVKNVTLSGSCIGRQPACGNPYWAQTVLATMTQVDGTYAGSLLDSSDLTPLLGPAMEETLRIQGEQTKYGVAEEFDGCVGVHVEAMNRGECALTYNWGNSFSDHVREGSTVRGKLGVAPTPGSTKVLNRKTGELEECTEELCPYAVLDERTGKLINQAPYGAYGGFSGAVSGSVAKENQLAAARFFAYATSAKKAIKYVIPDANNPDANPVPTGMDPYAKSMLNVAEWTSRGFDLKSTEEYMFAIESQLGSLNVVIDLRMPGATKFYDTLDAVTTQYCNDTKFDQFDNDAHAEAVRASLVNELTAQWKEIIADYDSAEGRQDGALLELYQRARGVYVAPKYNNSGFSFYNDGDGNTSNGVIVAIVICTTVVIAIVIFIVAYFVKLSAARKREDMWYVNPNDIHDTKEVLGRGSFGVVTKGFLRGTPVALKHAKGWEPDIPVKEGQAVDFSAQAPDKNGRDANRASITSSISDAKSDGIEDSTVGATLLTEPSSGQGWFHFFPQKQKQNADEHLRAELLLLVKLRHDNIVGTLGASQDNKKKQLVLILQYMENGPIRNVLKDPNGVAGTAGMSLEIQWALQVARGMNFLHTIPPPSGPMIHADLKSSNVLLDSCFNAHISDFGLATKTMGGLWGAIQRSAKSNNPRGSILWMAPEVLNGAEPTPASDVYSYSMFLVELMTRDRPFGVKAFEVKSTRRMSEFSAGTEYDRRSFSDSARRESEMTLDESDKQEIVEQPKQMNGSMAERRSVHRVSWSSDFVVATAIPETEVDDNATKGTRDTSISKPVKAGKDFFALINGETLTRDEIITKVKDLTLDPPFRPHLPENAPQILVDICTECWQKNPKRRPTMKEVEERLMAAVSSTTLTQQLMQRGSVFDSILPTDMQDKLARGEVIPPQTYNNVTVLFSDIVGFTSISSALTAEEVGDMIFRLFTKFDELCKANGVKKLDVIGDAFLGVCGVPNSMPDHASRASRFALDAIKAAQDTLICPTKPHLGYINVRFGLASGSVVATVIGSRGHPKFTLFGDTVNTASRMESTSQPNKCQVTQETANLIREYNEESVNPIVLVSRGETKIKGKGVMETFFVEEE